MHLQSSGSGSKYQGRNEMFWEHQGLYVDPARYFYGMYFGLVTNDEAISGADHSPGYLRTTAKLLSGQ